MSHLFCNFLFHSERVEVFEQFVNLLRVFNFQDVINFLFFVKIVLNVLNILAVTESTECSAFLQMCGRH